MVIKKEILDELLKDKDPKMLFSLDGSAVFISIPMSIINFI